MSAIIRNIDFELTNRITAKRVQG
ncbi:hypothetical protein OOU_Y34scaffold01028g10 [Pyricularia oryzae Y34]|uniref:Uncharacterized protein n=2 Tax=Pyricularia oryzae TaxID=318829 RepID=A0AA97NMG4_PYRO3|nr:hypothetical protein OOU_Y34scaffold01028g10 [Pyricularia oryzae Y34]